MENKIINSILRQDFSSFIHKVCSTINPGSKFISNWHIDLISEYLESVRKKQIKRLIINMPPRALKSVCVSVAFPSWLLGKNPKSRIMAASYSGALSVKHSLDTRFILESAWYKEIFPNTKLSKKHNQKTKFLTEQNGFRFATSVGGTATGEGGDYLIIDDPHNPVDIASNKKRENVINWFEQTFSTRLNDRNTGAIIIVMQRLHSEDLSGYLIKNKTSEWDLLKIPSLAHETKIFSFNDFFYKMEKGEVLQSKRDNIDIIEKLVSEIGPLNFAAQFQQEPVAQNASLVSEEDLVFCDKLPENFEYFIQSWDTAIKNNENADYSVCTIWGIKEENFYLIDVLREKLTYPKLKNSAISLIKKYNSNFILIEDKSSGQSLIQDLKNQQIHNIIAVRPTNDKVTRFATCTEYIFSGKVIIPKFMSWTHLVVSEVTNFPCVKNDDIVDSISQFLGFMKNKILTKSPRIRRLL